MSDVYRILLGFHIVAVALALAAFWGALLARKGGSLHRRCGHVFLVAMGVAATTVLVLSTLLLADPLAALPPGPELASTRYAEYALVLRELASGFVEVSLAVGALLHFGVRALRRRSRPRQPADLAVAGGATAAGLAIFALGFHPSATWFEGNGVFLALVGALELRALLRRRRSPTAWLVQHLVGMMGAGAIANGAFAVGVARLFTEHLEEMLDWGAFAALACAVLTAWLARRWTRHPGAVTARVSHA